MSHNELKFIYKSSVRQNLAGFDMKRIYWSRTIYAVKFSASVISLDFSTGEEEMSDVYDLDNFPKTRAIRTISK